MRGIRCKFVCTSQADAAPAPDRPPANSKKMRKKKFGKKKIENKHREYLKLRDGHSQKALSVA
jgi:hypothetical protein